MRKLWFASAALGLAMLLAPTTALADVNDFTITDFSADYYLTRDDPQGALRVKEEIDVRFTDDNHGIERALPAKYNGQDQHLEIQSVQRDGQTEKYRSYTSNGNKVLRIGDAKKTVTGAHTYVIEYSVQNVIRFVDGHDELDWNTNGLGWNQPFYKITARLHVPSGLTATNQRCYTGSYQSTETNYCETQPDGDVTTYQSTRMLQGGENMTFVAEFSSGSFAPVGPMDWWRDNFAKVLQIALPPIIAFIIGYGYWRRHGKDLRGRGTIVPEYGPPDGLRAAEADVINNYKLGTNAISATIIDLAIRHHLKIVETESKGVLGIGKKKEYSFQKLPIPTKDVLKPFEASVLKGLFESGEIVETDDLKNKFYKTSQGIQASIPAALTKEGYFPLDPKRVGTAFVIAATVVFFLAWFIIGADWPLAVGMIVAAIVLAIFAFLMPSRTQKGVDAKDKLAGLKMYMETAEKDRIAMLQSPDAPYANKSDTPERTVELFEKLLPFAMVMGVEKQWAKQFENIYTAAPDWYSGNWTAFSTAYLISSLGSTTTAMNNSFAAPSSSSSGSGGSFSGGGGGGGGGGGW